MTGTPTQPRPPRRNTLTAEELSALYETLGERERADLSRHAQYLQERTSRRHPPSP